MGVEIFVLKKPDRACVQLFKKSFVSDLCELYGFILKKDRYLRALAFAALQID